MMSQREHRLFLDISDRPRLQSPGEAVGIAVENAPDVNQEWLVIFFLTRHYQALPESLLITDLGCTEVLDPQPYLRRAIDVHAAILLPVRYHPHRWGHLTRHGLQAYEYWRACTEAAGMSLYDALVIDAEGGYFSMSGRDRWEKWTPSEG